MELSIEIRFLNKQHSNLNLSLIQLIHSIFHTASETFQIFPKFRPVSDRS